MAGLTSLVARKAGTAVARREAREAAEAGAREAAQREAAATAKRTTRRAATPAPEPSLAVTPKKATTAPAKTTKRQSSLVVPKSPAIITARSGTPQGLAQDVLSEVTKGKGTKAAPSYAQWTEANAGPGQLFDYSTLHEVPDVPQFQLDRYVPARGPSARMVDALNDPNVVQGVNDTVRRGIEGGGMDWYNTDQLRQYFRNPEDYARFMDYMASTSPRSKVPDNIRIGSYYNYLVNNDLPIPLKPAAGYGSKAQDLHRGNVVGLLDRGGWDIFQNPKPASFSQNLQGNQAVATIDTHNMRLPAILSQDPRFLETSMQETFKGNRDAAIENLRARFPGLSDASLEDATAGVSPTGGGKVTYRPQRWNAAGELDIPSASKDPILWATKPKDNEYGYYERWQQDQARKMGISPAQYQASMWLGGGEDTGLGSAPEPFLRTLENRVRYTADRLGEDPNAILRHFTQGNIPLMAKGGSVNADALARQNGFRSHEEMMAWARQRAGQHTGSVAGASQPSQPQTPQTPQPQSGGVFGRIIDAMRNAGR